jgi:branched-chain amino acid transport system permease protein
MSGDRTGWRNRKASFIGWIILGLLVLTLPFSGSDYLLTLMITSLHFVYLSQSWNLIFGYSGQLALGHGLFYGITGYFSTKLLMAAGVSPYLGALLGAVTSALVAIPLGALLFRSKLKGLYLGLVTLAAMEILKSIFNNWPFVGSSAGIYLPLKDAPRDFMFLSRLPYYFIALFMVLVLLAVTRTIEKSKLGHRAIAARENEEAAEASGINCFRVKLTMFVLSAFFTGLAGTFYAQFMLYIVPEIMFGFNNTVLLPMLGVIVGGRGTVFGPILGSIVFSLLGEALRRIPFLHGPQVSAATMMIYGIVLTIVSIRYYGGLLALVSRWKTKSGGAGDYARPGSTAMGKV